MTNRVDYEVKEERCSLCCRKHTPHNNYSRECVGSQRLQFKRTSVPVTKTVAMESLWRTKALFIKYWGGDSVSTSEYRGDMSP